MTTIDRASVVLFALGPVQDFIATARKGQDFWFGSWLLSELSRAAAIEARTLGAELVLPSATSLDRGDAIANKVLARVRSEDAERVVVQMEGAVRAALRRLAAATLETVERGREGKHLRRASAEAQIDDLPEIYWVVVDEVPEDWTESRRRAESALAARKSVRDFDPVTWGAPAPKSHLDGQRESVIDEHAYRGGSPGGAERLRQTFGIGPAERLCGVGLLKRTGHRVLDGRQARGARVLSTSHVASWSLRRAWAHAPSLHAELRAAFRRYKAALPDAGDALSDASAFRPDPVLEATDGQALYAERLAEAYTGDALVAARGELAKFLRVARGLLASSDIEWPVLSPYYAVLRADGDRMGAWLDRVPTLQGHQRASEALGSFANGAEAIVDAHHGHCVFAGGDDVLALLPVNTALDCAAALNESFNTSIAEGPGPDRPTLSVGVQVAHAIAPFREALEGAREAEHAAKERYGRGAICVRVDKRSGAPVLIGGKWDELGGIRELQRLQDPGEDGMSRGLAHDLRRVADRLDGEAMGLATIRALEVDRVLRQKNLDQKGYVTAAIWARLGGRDLGARTLRGVCDELVVTRALAALDGDDA